MKDNLKYNAEGCKDGTAFRAIMSMNAEQRKMLNVQAKHDNLIKHLKYVVELSGFRLDGRIHLVHKSSGKRFE